MGAWQTIVAAVLLLSTGPRHAVGHLREPKRKSPDCFPPCGDAQDERPAHRVVHYTPESTVDDHRKGDLLNLPLGQEPLNYLSSGRRLAENAASWRKGFPTEGFSETDKSNGAVLIYMFGMFYMFVAIAITCDEFFVPALEVLSDRLQLSADVAGATLMAMGGSAPEFFTSCVGTWIAQTDVGIGTIVGSAVFNVLFVIGSCAITSPMPLELTWWPLFRDSSFYTVGLVLLTVFFIDERIEWWEASTLFGLYIVYCIFMHNSERIELFVKTKFIESTVRIAPATGDPGLSSLSVVPADGDNTSSANSPTPQDRNHLSPTKEPGSDEESPKHRQAYGSTGSTDWMQADSRGSPDQEPLRGSKVKYLAGGKSGPSEPGQNERQDPAGSPRACSTGTPIGKSCMAVPETGSTAEVASNREAAEAASSQQENTRDGDAFLNSASEKSAASTESGESIDKGEDQTSQSDSLEDQPLEVRIPDCEAGWRAWVWFLMTLPIIVTLTFTVPDVRRPGREWLYAAAFIISICWVALFTYLMVWFASVVAETFGMSVSLMGLTVLAVGTSIPDFITSVIVAKQGKGDMAVSSSIGSNIFDITVGLPVPWFCYIMWNHGQSVKVDRSGLHISIPLLLAMLVCTIATIRLNRWVMTKVMGFCMFALYAAFMTQGVVTSVISESSRK